MDSPGHIFDALPDMPRERRWRQQQRPVWGVIVLIRRPREGEPDRYLLIRRRHEPYAGQWALVGGKVEFGETLAMAAEREVKEESDLDGRFVALRGIVNERLAPAGPQDAAGHFLLFVCTVEAPDGVAQEQLEGRVAWFTLAEIDDLQRQQAIIPSDYAMLQQFGGNEESVPYFEAEIVAANPERDGEQTMPPHLNRFERMDRKH